MTKTNKEFKIGLVLSGGGAKGAYEAGVIKALWDLDLQKHIQVVSGTSIGVINALMFGMQDIELVEDGWNCITYGHFMSLDESVGIMLSNLIPKHKTNQQLKALEKAEQLTGVISQKGIREYIKKYLDMNKLKNSCTDLYACAYNTNKQTPVYFKLNDYKEEEVIDIALASCAIPYIFKPIKIKGDCYSDGGFTFGQYNNADNFPITPLQNYECDLTIVVHLDYIHKVNHKLFPNQHIIEIYPSQNLDSYKHFASLNLHQESIHKRMDMGYRDTLVTLSPLLLAYFRGENILPLIQELNFKNIKTLRKKNRLSKDFIKLMQTGNI